MTLKEEEKNHNNKESRRESRGQHYFFELLKRKDRCLNRNDANEESIFLDKSLETMQETTRSSTNREKIVYKSSEFYFILFFLFSCIHN